MGVGYTDDANRRLVARWNERRSAKIEEYTVDYGDQVLDRGL